MKSFKELILNVKRTIKLFYKYVPIAISIVLLYFGFIGVYPAIYTLFSTRVFESIGMLFLSPNKSLLWTNLLLLMFLFVSKNVLEMIVDVPRSCSIYSKMKCQLNINLSRKAANDEYIKFEDSEFYNRLTRAKQCISSNKMQRFIFGILTITFTAVGMIGTIAILYSFNGWLPTILIIATLPYVAVIKIRGLEYYEIQNKQIPLRRKKDYLWGLFFDKSSVKEARIYNSSDYLYDEWDKCRNSVFDEELSYVKKESRYVLICNVIQIIGVFTGIGLSLILVWNDKISVGELVSVVNSFFIVQGSLTTLINGISDTVSSNKYVSDYFSYVEDSENIFEEKTAVSFIDSMSFNAVSFKYPNQEKWAVEDINLTIKKGEKVVVVGENGSGKTTLSKILLGLLIPQTGDVRVNDYDLRVIDKERFYNLCSIVPQNYTKYALPLYDNVSLSDEKDIKRIKTILRKMNIVEDNMIDENILLGREFGGYELSGGQWQKLAIARGLYQNSELIVLDEPTAALDPLVENEILNQFVKMSNDKMALIITHRVGLCSIADKVLVMHDGKLIAQGKHEELLKNCSYYNNLYTSQQSWYV